MGSRRPIPFCIYAPRGRHTSTSPFPGTETSPVMQPIYADHPLTEQEQADLLAFMKSSAGQPEADMELPVLGLSMLGTVGAAGVLGFVYRNRLRRVRKALVDQAQKELL